MIKSYDAYHIFEKIIFTYGIEAAIRFTDTKKGKNKINALQELKLDVENLTWINIGGQLIPEKKVKGLIQKIKSSEIENWNQVHKFYETESDKYNSRKDLHAMSCLEKLTQKSFSKISTNQFINWLDTYLEIKKDITLRIQNTRAKDYANPFRKMVYENEAEMNTVIGNLADNSFIKEQKNVLKQLETKIAGLKKELG